MVFDFKEQNLSIVGRPVFGKPALVLVPKLEKMDVWSNLIKPGSSIVGFCSVDAVAMICYYEGNLYDAENLRTFEDRAICAYGRMTSEYPTIAMCFDQMKSLEIIGTLTQDGLMIKKTPAYLAWVALDKTLRDKA